MKTLIQFEVDVEDMFRRDEAARARILVLHKRRRQAVWSVLCFIAAWAALVAYVVASR